MHTSSLCSLILALLTLTLLPSTALAEAPPKQKDAPPKKGLLEQADAIAEQVAELRGLPLKSKLERGVRTRTQLRDFLVEAISEEYTPAQIEAEAQTFKHLGLLPAELDYAELILSLLTEQIAGFYDPKVKELYIMTGLANAIQAPTMAHEIFHALQDQHYDLLSLQGPFDPATHSDFTLARSALFEGDATVLMLDFTLYEQKILPKPATDSSPAVTTMAQMPSFTQTMRTFSVSNLLAMEKLMGGGSPSAESAGSAVDIAPPLIKESLLFPYLAGLRFTLLAYEELGSWKAFQDRLYSDAPVSTEQILHPERYFSGDMPTLIGIDPGAALPGFTRIYDNVLGEFQMHLALRQHIRFARPQGAPLVDVDVDAAMEGWGGDRLLAYRHDDTGQITTVHLSTWDSQQDAIDYHAALETALSTRYHGRLEAMQSASAGLGKASYFTTTDAGLTYIERWGDTVLHIEGIEAPKPGEKLTAKYPPLRSLRDATYGSLERLDFEAEMNRLLEEKKEAASPSEQTSP